MNSDIQYVSLRGSVSVLFLLLISLETMRYMGGGECVCVGGTPVVHQDSDTVIS